MISKPLKGLGLITVLILSSACETRVIRNYCQVTEPHYFSNQAIDAMTDEEAEREADHNDLWRDLCD